MLEGNPFPTSSFTPHSTRRREKTTTEFLWEFKGNMVQQHQTEILSFYWGERTERLKCPIKVNAGEICI